MAGRYYLSVGDYEKADKYYRLALKDCKAELESSEGGFERPLRWTVRQGCNAGLTLTTSRKGALAEAEEHYKVAIEPWQNLSAAEIDAQLQEQKHAPERTNQALLASSIAQAYAKSGNNQEAAQKFASSLAFESVRLRKVVDPMSSLVPMSAWRKKLPDIETDNIDRFIGTLPSAASILRPYLTFAQQHPDLVPTDQSQRISDELQKVIGDDSIAKFTEKNPDWRATESVQMDKLDEQPQDTLSQLQAGIDARKKDDPNNPSIPHSLSIIGYNLMLEGQYRQSEQYLKDAMALREKQGPAARYALGNACSNLGTLYLAEQKLPEARELLQRALQLRHDDPADSFAEAKTEIAYGRLLAAEGKKTQGEEEIKKALAVLSTNDFISRPVKRGDLIPLGGPEIVHTMESKSQKLDQNMHAHLYCLLAQIELANLYLADKNYDLAKQTLAPVLASTPVSPAMSLIPRAQEKMARVETAQGQLQSAEKRLAISEASVRSHKTNGMAAVDILNALGDLKTKQGDAGKAKAYYAEAAQRLAKMLGR